MKNHFYPIILLFFSLQVSAQHWPTYQLQHDSIYKKAGVKTIEWREDSTKTFAFLEAEVNLNGFITKLDAGDQTIYFEYNEDGMLTGESDWDGDAILKHDENNKVTSKVISYEDGTIAREVKISYDPKIIVAKKYNEQGTLIKRQEYYFDSENTVREYVIETPYTYGEIRYKYLNQFNEQGQIISTTNMSIVGEASYQYLPNGLLDKVIITHSTGQTEGDPPIIQQLSYTYH